MDETVHSSVSDVAREARALAQSLKEAIKRNEGLEKEVEIIRKRLRTQHLKLLLLYPTSKEAKDVETHLWMQTSYQFISLYKQRLAVLDKKLFSPASESNKAPAAGRQEPGEDGHVVYRKLLLRFRQSLAEEQKFYEQLLIRFQTQFGLKESRPALMRAEILRPEEDDAPQADSRFGRSIFPEMREMVPETDEEREVRLAAFTKLLVCLGDIARYREQYHDGGGRPRAGHEEGPPRRTGRGGRRGGRETTVARPRNYTRAKIIYEQARLLLPNDGNASHQLAILSSYQNNSFGSLLDYYRALCVRQPYDTASDNLNTVLKKALDQYRSSKGTRAAGDDPQAAQKIRVDRFLEFVVVLHGLWYLDTDEHAARAARHGRLVVARFKSLVSEPALPPHIISEVLISAFSALWKIRMIRDKHVRADRKDVEPMMTAHILALCRTLYEAGTEQLAVKIEDIQDREDLAQRITAVLRRMLPAIRIASKWLRTNINYISTEPAVISDSYKNDVGPFWESYAAFLTSLIETFPLPKLPALKNSLDEDVDLAGFSPIKRVLFVPPVSTENELASGQDSVHPNEEYLMRISDVLRDAEEMVAVENTPITMEDGRFGIRDEQQQQRRRQLVFDDGHKGSRGETSSSVEQESMPVGDGIVKVAEEADEEDDNMSQTTRTDDDVVRDAFNEALRDDRGTDGDEEEEEEERIVWSPPRMPLSPLQKIVQPPQMSPQLFPSVHSPVSATASPARPAPPTITSSGTTAQDLFNNVFGLSRPRNESASFGNQQPAPPAFGPSGPPQNSLLFKSKSIWSNHSGSGSDGGNGGQVPTLGSTSHFRSDSLVSGGGQAGERARSRSLSQTSLSQSQTLQDSIYQGLPGPGKAALPVGHVGVGMNFGRAPGVHRHQHSVSVYEPPDGLRSGTETGSGFNVGIGAGAGAGTGVSPGVGSGTAAAQVLYDSYVSHASVPPASVPATTFASGLGPGPGPPMHSLVQGLGAQGYGGQGAVGGRDRLLYYDSQGTNSVGSPASATVNQSIWGR